ncbi:MAG: phenylalanine--tRNA ligase subunit alpha [Dehalococcoidia bacterium]|nr:phenylalanine--tRNA ligase subunit alpha [Dehalococcoidia bacterium]
MTTNASDLTRTLEALREEALRALDAAESEERLEAWRVAYLGRREGKLTLAMRQLGALSPEARPAAGAAANQVKLALDEGLARRQEALKERALERMAQAQRLDVTMPGRPVPLGRLHPTTQMLREVLDAFTSMGFQVAEGPEVELDRYNFELLNIPKGHPARDMWDTLWIDHTDANGERPMLLRTHTSPMQARVMEKTEPPVRVVVPGKVYRYENTDATHEWHFHQVEGLAVDEGITFANLKGTLYEFARRIFGPERRVRFRCDYFPFVEPGVDMAMDCFMCKGEGHLRSGGRSQPCRVCKETGWIEIMGAGMVHPRVLEMVGYDPQKYTGFAFGLGVERIAMLKHGIDDIRLFYANDVRFLRQF